MMELIRTRNRKRGRKIAPKDSITYPDKLELRYRRALSAIVRDMRKATELALEPIIRSIESKEIKTDALDDVRMIEVVEGLEIRLGRELNRDNWIRTVRETAESVSEHNGRELQEVLTIDPRSGADQADIDGFVRENVDLIQGFSSHAQRRMQERIQRAIREGTNGKELRDIIQRTFDVSESRARLLARDQVGKLNGQLNRNRQTRVGVTKYKWLTVNDERVRGKKMSKGKIVGRGRHWQLHGEIFSWDAPPQVSTDGRREHPGGDYQCRCQAVPVIDFDTIGKVSEQEPDPVRTPVARPRSAPRTAPAPRPVQRVQRTPAPSSPRTSTPVRRNRTPPTDLTLQAEVSARLRVGRSVLDIARDLRITERTVLNIARRLGLTHLT